MAQDALATEHAETQVPLLVPNPRRKGMLAVGIMKRISTRRINDPELEGPDGESRVMRLLWLREKNRNKPESYTNDIKVVSKARDGWSQGGLFE